MVQNGPRLDVNPSVRMLVRDAPVPMAIIDLEGHAWIWNAAAETLFPPPPQNTLTSYPLFSIGTQPWFVDVRRAGVDGRGTSGVEWRPRGVGGTQFRLKLALIPVRDSDQSVGALIVQLADETAADRRQRRTWRRARRAQSMLDETAEALLVHQAGRIVYANHSAARLLGVHQRENLIGLDFDSQFSTITGQRASTIPHKTYAALNCVPDSTSTVELLPRTVRFGHWKAMQVTLRETQAVEPARSRQQSDHLRGTTDSVSAQGVILLDAVGYVTSWNAGAHVLTGYRAQDIMGRDLAFLYNRDEIDNDEPGHALRAAISEGRYSTEGWRMRKDGRRFWCNMTVNALFNGDQQIEAFAVLLSDTTSKRTGEPTGQATDEQLRQAQRMEAIGRLAGGIAHDFNNLLTAIQGHVQFLIDELADDSPSSQDAQEIKRSADRAAALTRQLLAFSRNQEMELRVVDLNEIIADMGTLLRRVIDEDICCRRPSNRICGRCVRIPGQIEQVVMNLVVNARDALPNGGTISIRTSNADIDAEVADHRLDVRPGPYALLTVSDNGVGMDLNTQAHASSRSSRRRSRARARGSGWRRVRHREAEQRPLWVQSEPGRGTTFKVYLPRAVSPEAVSARTSKYAAQARIGETVLLIEDGWPCAHYAPRTRIARLQCTGCRHGRRRCAHRGGLQRPDPPAALQCRAARHEWPRDRERIIRIRPETRPLFVSGYTDYNAKLQGVIDARAPFLEKPSRRIPSPAKSGRYSTLSIETFYNRFSVIVSG